jgi:hypothetical protein
MAKAGKAGKAQKGKVQTAVVTTNPPNKVAVVLGNTVSLVINAVLLYYVLRLEGLTGCDCVGNWRKDYLKYYSIFSMAVSVISVALMNHANKFTMSLIAIRGLANILAIYCLYTYTQDLADNCPCSTDDTTNKNLNKFFSLYATIIAVMIIASLALSMFMLLSLMFATR